MKITFEFANIKDMLNQLPKFAQLITSDEPAEKRIETALADDPTALIMKITPANGIPFTEEEKEAIKATITQFTDMARIEKIEKLREELTVQDLENAGSDAPEEKAKKNPPKAKKPKNEPEPEADEAPAKAATETEARSALNGLVKSRSNAAVKLVFHELGVKNFGDLKNEDQYTKAVELAAKVDAMNDDEYAEALKEVGIKGGKK
ncbi:MAG: hypothetical protein IKF99_00060 [Oscillospiraceae bacterium]|nr:hypothetical protein [Oscillospiraceae bacterium]